MTDAEQRLLEERLDRKWLERKNAAKYKTWKELLGAFRSGEIDKTEYGIVMDNDRCELEYFGDDTSKLCDDGGDSHCEPLFLGDGYCDIVDVLKACGVPARWC